MGEVEVLRATLQKVQAVACYNEPTKLMTLVGERYA